jgi:predicted metal-dependent phosphoesterase TrpH
LGYRIDPSNPALVGGIREIRAGRSERNEEIFRRLTEIGRPVSPEEVGREAGGTILGRPHFAKALVRKGYAADPREAFVRYLARGAEAYVSRWRPEPEEAIRWIHEAGGVAVVAHPVQTGLDSAGLDALLRKLKGYGLWGLECLTPKHSNEQCLEYLRLADRLGLFPTAGTDYHGDDAGGSLGVQVREDLLPWTRLGVEL